MKRNTYTLGLDVGIASCGYALVDLEGKRIVRAGVRCFERGENPEDGSSLAMPRRQKRLLRRIIRRRRQRLGKLSALLRGAFGHESVVEFKGHAVWSLRVEALDRILTGAELEAVFRHIAKRRGFRSSRRSAAVESKDDDSEMLSAVGRLESEFRTSGFRTVGEWLFKTSKGKLRNEHGAYHRTVLRRLLEEEVETIVARQLALGDSACTSELTAQIKSVSFDQKPLQSTLHMVGYCRFEPAEKRAALRSWTAERCHLLQKLNHLRLRDGGKEIPLSAAQCQSVAELAYNKDKITYALLRKHLDLETDIKFVGLRYALRREEPEQGEKSKTKDPEAAVFAQLKGWHTLRKALKEQPRAWEQLKSNTELLDAIVFVLTVEKDERAVERKLLQLGLEREIVDAFLPVSFTEHAALSLLALGKILPHLEKGLVYSEACAAAGYRHSDAPSSTGKSEYLPVFPQLTNPVVNRALSQCRKVVNALIREYGLPSDVHIEIARDMSKSFDERREIESEQKERQAYNEKVIEHFKEVCKREPRPLDITKFKLWKEQGQRCAYSLRYIEPAQFDDPQALEIDHIIPFSRCFDDSWSNKVLVFTEENRNKGDRIPAEYFGNDAERWARFEVFAAGSNLPSRKQRNLLKCEFTEADESEWKERHLNDTRYISRSLMNHIREHLALENDGHRHVFSRKGPLTAALRYFWGLQKDRAANDRHHALDAIVVACSTESMLSRVSEYRKMRERGLLLGKSSLERAFPLPWEEFRNCVAGAVADVFVSRMPHRKVTGPAHKDKIRSERVLSDGTRVIVERIRLESLKLKDLENLWELERNRAMYDVLRERLIAHNGDPKKAFAEPVYKPCRRAGQQGPRIKAVTVSTSKRSGVYVRGAGKNRRGIASNGSMVRCDVFEKNGKFYLVPVYVADMVRQVLPSRAITANKPENEWPIIDETYVFKFSLYPNDLISIVQKDGTARFGYYRGLDRSKGAVTIMAHDGSEAWSGVGGRTLQRFEKYVVDVLGRHWKVRSEKRHGLEGRCRRKRRKAKLQPEAVAD